MTPLHTSSIRRRRHLVIFSVIMSLVAVTLLLVPILLHLTSSSSLGPNHSRAEPVVSNGTTLVFPFEKTLWMDASSLAKCPKDMFSCAKNSSSRCLSLERRCDGRVDCPNATDEVNCVCAFRLPAVKFCDQYADCFDESDESFCSYCPEGSFNCGDGKCVPAAKVCDATPDCGNFADENSCFSISSDANASLPGLRTGFLLRRHQGAWLPVCAHPHDRLQGALATHACSSITANPLSTGTLQHRKFPAKMTSYIYHYMGKFVPWPDCGSGSGMFLSCGADAPCGLDPRRNPRARIVGGERARPGSWPWHAAVYKNGTYACGATLVSERWLVSAAHCFLNHRFNYYEVQLGMLRRRSFSPHQQTLGLDVILAHPKFNIVTLEYDLALLRTARRVPLGPFVRPICVPGRIAGAARRRPAGLMCTAVGWGDVGEMEDDSDELREVHVPLTRVCKRNLDRWLCAGYREGGRDACQGDSGGPLMCPGPDGASWEIAGVISAGTGCARPKTPGMYTRVAYFRDWIDQVMQSRLKPDVPPLGSCPGLRCAALGGGNCLNLEKVCDGHVDCYDARDEVNCTKKLV